MSRLASSVVIVALALSALGLYQYVHIQPAATASLSPSDLRAVRDYYAALNTYFVTGDAVKISEHFTADASVSLPDGQQITATGFDEYLAAIRSTYPDLSVDARDVVRSDDHIAVSVEVSFGAARTPAWLDIGLTPARADRFDTFLIENGLMRRIRPGCSRLLT